MPPQRLWLVLLAALAFPGVMDVRASVGDPNTPFAKAMKDVEASLLCGRAAGFHRCVSRRADIVSQEAEARWELGGRRT